MNVWLLCTTIYDYGFEMCWGSVKKVFKKCQEMWGRFLLMTRNCCECAEKYLRIWEKCKLLTEGILASREAIIASTTENVPKYDGSLKIWDDPKAKGWLSTCCPLPYMAVL